MTTRRQAASPGKAPIMRGVLDEIGEQAQFDDFRRRHSKQNRDIVRENASRLMLNKALQEEIVNLHRELLAVRQTTASMALKIKSLEDEMAHLRSEPTRMAVDAILSAVPALRQLQSALVPSPSAAVTEPPVELSKVIPWPEKPLLARQMQSEHMLEALTERTEVESECESDRDVPTPPRRPRRRESGFIRLPTFSPELEVVDTGRERVRDEEGEVEHIVMDTVQEESESPRGEPPSSRRPAPKIADSGHSRQPCVQASTTAEMKSISRVQTKAGKPSRSLSASTASSERRAVVSRKPEPADKPVAVNSKPVSTSEAKDREDGASVKLSRPEEVSTIDEDGARSRTGRARKSINYKEPSLHKKMRKPDSDDEGDSAHYSSSAGVRRKSVLPKHRMVQNPVSNMGEAKGTEQDEGRVENSTVRMLLGLDE